MEINTFLRSLHENEFFNEHCLVHYSLKLFLFIIFYLSYDIYACKLMMWIQIPSLESMVLQVESYKKKSFAVYGSLD